MENITQLRDDLLKHYKDLVEGSLDIKTAKEISNTAGKILSSAKVQLEYNVYTGNKNKIKFLEGK
jgi:hypothetical protein